jgi:cell wall-associated NlpC family hydrolase
VRFPPGARVVAGLVALAGLAGLAAIVPGPAAAAPSRVLTAAPRPLLARSRPEPNVGPGTRRPAVLPPRPAWIAVTVATVWDHPATARPQDAAAVSADPHPARWLAGLNLQEKLGLDDLLATQALLDQPVSVLGKLSGWDQVRVEGQTGSVYPDGIVGWVPDAQLTFTAPAAAPERATVAVPILRIGGLVLSYGTVLPARPTDSDHMAVGLPTGWFPVAASDLRAVPRAPSGSAVLTQAEQFLGLPYLWAGTSAFGFDCSGLTYSVYRQFGVTLARDAADQAAQGTPVARADLRPGDLVFFAFGGPIEHVGIYAGNGLMVDAPETGKAIELVPLWGGPMAPYFAGARRYF